MSDNDILFTLFMAWVTLIWICLNPESWIRLRAWMSTKVDQRSTKIIEMNFGTSGRPLAGTCGETSNSGVAVFPSK